MRIIYLIFGLFIVLPCFAADFDNPYSGYYTATANTSRDFDSPYMKYYNIISELKLNYANARAREQSTANKMLGAVTIAATGIGAMNWIGGMAEQKADNAAERDMKAYLATFTCEYGGHRAKGGDTNIELPGGNDLLDLATEYKALALDLKERKDVLGLRAGIESEEIIDPATSGLYDNVGIGRQGGAFTSLSRALTDENSADAKAWGEQKSSAKSRTKTGAIVGGAGAVGGAIGNVVDGLKNKKNPN